TLPTWLTLVDQRDGTATLSGTPAMADDGTHLVVLRVKDAAGATATQSFTIAVGVPAKSFWFYPGAGTTFSEAPVLTDQNSAAVSAFLAARRAANPAAALAVGVVDVLHSPAALAIFNQFPIKFV